MTQYCWELILSDGDLSLVRALLQEHIQELTQKNIPIGTFATNLNAKLDNISPRGNLRED